MRTGTLRLVPGATIEIGEGIGWAQWLPGSRQLIAGGVGGEDGSGVWKANHFLVDSVTRSSTPFSFLRDGQQDVNYSAVVLPGAERQPLVLDDTGRNNLEDCRSQRS